MCTSNRSVDSIVHSSRISSRISGISGVVPIHRILVTTRHTCVTHRTTSSSFSRNTKIITRNHSVAAIITPSTRIHILLATHRRIQRTHHSNRSASNIKSRGITTQSTTSSGIAGFASTTRNILAISGSSLGFNRALSILIHVISSTVRRRRCHRCTSGLSSCRLSRNSRKLVSKSSFINNRHQSNPGPINILTIIKHPGINGSALIGHVLNHHTTIIRSAPNIAQSHIDCSTR